MANAVRRPGVTLIVLPPDPTADPLLELGPEPVAADRLKAR
jgi:hypothetical protein